MLHNFIEEEVSFRLSYVEFREREIMMKVVYDEKYAETYISDPAAAAGRMECIFEAIKEHVTWIKPAAASEEDLKLVHSPSHIDTVKENGPYEHALLAVGGAIRSSEIALQGEPCFGLIRPPGHHASPDSPWGFCYFNNIAISLQHLREKNAIKRALIVDFDAHYGDGTANIFAPISEVSYYHPPKGHEQAPNEISKYLRTESNYDILALSAGFDRHEKDWGGSLKTEDFRTIGRLAREFAERICEGKRYAVLEGGYNQDVLGKNVLAFLQGFE